MRGAYQTRQKREMTRFLASHAMQGFTPEGLARAMEAEGVRVGVTTAYRFLESLCHQQTARRSQDAHGISRYQYHGGDDDCDRHFHVMCSHCGTCSTSIVRWPASSPNISMLGTVSASTRALACWSACAGIAKAIRREGTGMALMELKDVTVAFEGHAAVEHVDLRLGRGEYTVMLGRNGSGKSTLMRAMLGLVRPKGGQILVGDGLRRGHIGYMPQKTQAQRDFPAAVEEVVRSGLINRMGRRVFYAAGEKARALDNMRLLGIEGLRRKPYATLSGGQQQRVLLARHCARRTTCSCSMNPSPPSTPRPRRSFTACCACCTRSGAWPSS